MAACCQSEDINTSVSRPGGGVWDLTEGSAGFTYVDPAYSRDGQEYPSDATTMPEMPINLSSDGSSKNPDSFIADALQSMSFEERDGVYREVHGIADVIPETPEFLRQSFDHLRQELFRIVDRGERTLEYDAFLLAEKMNYKYVHSNFFYKAFLRAERFDIHAAAQRMINFYDFKKMCFGKEHLCSDITQSMFTAEDLDALKKGFEQILPARDRTGRAVSIMFPHEVHVKTAVQFARCLLYRGWCSMQDEETQKKGVALIIFDVGNENNRMPVDALALIRVAAQAARSNPSRVVCMHHCYSDRRFEFMIQMGMRLYPRKFRARHKLHRGSAIECTYSLMGYGIQQDSLPITVNGEVKTKQYLGWLHMRRVQEEWIAQGKLLPNTQRGDGGSLIIENDPSWYSPYSVIALPGSADILFGRGKSLHLHPGNLQLHRMVDEAVPRHDASRKLDKTALSHELVMKVKTELGGRFLKQDGSTGVWLVTDDETARLKISRLFRARRQIVRDRLAKQKKGKANEDDSVTTSASDSLAKRIKRSF